MKYCIIALILAFTTGCREQITENLYKLHHPNTVITIAARESESDDFFELRYGASGTYMGRSEESSRRIYGTDVITKGVHVKYEVLSSQFISNDGDAVINGHKYRGLIPADVYLFQIKVPNELWQSICVVYTGVRYEVVSHDKIKITIQESEQTASSNH